MKSLTVLLFLPFLLSLPACDDEESAEDEILFEAQQNLPQGKKLPPLTDSNLLQGGGPEVKNLFPPDLDQDTDGFIDKALADHPEYPVDNCPLFFNPDQEDSNQNGVGDACE